MISINNMISLKRLLQCIRNLLCLHQVIYTMWIQVALYTCNQLAFSNISLHQMITQIYLQKSHNHYYVKYMRGKGASLYYAHI